MVLSPVDGEEADEPLTEEELLELMEEDGDDDVGTADDMGEEFEDDVPDDMLEDDYDD